MELRLTLENGKTVQVERDGRASHAFALDVLVSAPSPEALYNALFPPGTAPAERLALVFLDEALDALPWEAMRGPDGFMALEMPLVRLLPPENRIPAPRLDAPLRVLAVPANPVAWGIAPLNIAGEWDNLKKIVRSLKHAAQLERVNPPTLDALRLAALHSPQAVIHFMGHGGQTEGETMLCFESIEGGLDAVSAKDVALSLGKQAFFVTLNACVSAAPGPTQFSNLARLLVRRGIPYALGMSDTIPDSAALSFSRTLYENLSAGVDVEQAVFQARRSLLRSNPDQSLIAVPVLYSSLAEPAAGFQTPPGTPQVDKHQPQLEVSDLPRAEGAFQGRIGELLALGKALTGEPRAKLLTIHGVGGQGKTALAREAVERFAHAWPGGVWAISLENKPSRATFCFQLAQFLNIPTDRFPKTADLERAVLAQLENQSILIGLDNAETFVQAVRANDADALELAAFLKENLRGTAAGLLVTSREPLGWSGELALPLEGLNEAEGAALFTQSAPQRQQDIQTAQAATLSRQLGGHPLALRLLGLAFNESATSLETFLAEHQTRLLAAEDKYKAVEHRHRTLYASIETSIRHLNEAERALLSSLWIFQAPFFSETAAAIFAVSELTEAQREQTSEQLHTLYQRGLLLREQETLAYGNLLLYRSLPTVRMFAKEYLAQALPIATLQARMCRVCSILLEIIVNEINSSSWASYLASRCREDLEACVGWATSDEQGWYMNWLGWVLQRIGDRRAGLHWLEDALEIAEGTDRNLQLHIINNIANIYSDIGQPMQALAFFEQALSLMREVGDRAGKAATLNNMGSVYRTTGQPIQALALYEQALPLMREVGDRAGEASILNNMGSVYRATGQPMRALALYEQVLPIRREVGDWAGEATTLSDIAGVYSDTGQPEQALALYKQALPLMREVGDRPGEAVTLNNIANVYRIMGQPNQALALYEQALPITCQVGDRAGEATALNNIANVYNATGQPMQALALYEQALPLMREVGNRAGEAAILNNIADLYNATGQPMWALALYEQALLIRREVGDRAGEASTLNNMANVYRNTEQLGQALALHEQALPLMREVGDRAGEAAILNNIADLYSHTGQPEQALALFEQALPIRREVGDRPGEAVTLNNMANVYRNIGQSVQALALFEQPLPIRREVGDRAGEATTCFNMAMLAREMGDAQRALELLQQVVTLEKPIQHPDYAKDAATLAEWEAAVARGEPLPGSSDAAANPTVLSQAQVQTIANNTLAVLTKMHEKRAEWHEAVAGLLQQVQANKQQLEIEFLTAILALLDGEIPAIPVDNPYAWAAQAILQNLPTPSAPPILPADFVARCAAAICGSIEQKMTLANELAALAKDAPDAARLALIDTIQQALFGAQVESLGQGLSDKALKIWNEIVQAIKG